MIDPEKTAAHYYRLRELGQFHHVHESGDLIVAVDIMEHAADLTDEELGAVVRLACMAEYFLLSKETRRRIYERNGWKWTDSANVGDRQPDGAESGEPSQGGTE